nr:unnamed protein product [Naegleria fowleri]
MMSSSRTTSFLDPTTSRGIALEIEQHVEQKQLEQIHPFRSGQLIPFQSCYYEFRVESWDELLNEGKKKNSFVNYSNNLLIHMLLNNNANYDSLKMLVPSFPLNSLPFTSNNNNGMPYPSMLTSGSMNSSFGSVSVKNNETSCNLIHNHRDGWNGTNFVMSPLFSSQTNVNNSGQTHDVLNNSNVQPISSQFSTNFVSNRTPKDPLQNNIFQNYSGPFRNFTGGISTFNDVISQPQPQKPAQDISRRIPVKLILKDFHTNLSNSNISSLPNASNDLTQLQQKLFLKFQNQIRGFVKWFKRREEKLQNIQCSESNDMIPLEFLNDHTLMDKLIHSTTSPLNHSMRIPPWIYLNVDAHNIPHDLKSDKNFFIKGMNNFGTLVWKFIPNSLKSDQEIIDAMVEQFIEQGHTQALKYASQKLKDDSEFVMKALRHGGECLQYASDRLKDSLPHVLRSLPGGLVHASERFRQDFELALQLVNSNGLCLQYLSKELRSNRQIVASAVEQDGNALQFASEELRDDTTIVDIAIENDPDCIRFASHHILSCKSYMMDVVSTDGFLLQYASKNLKEDEEIVEKAFLNDPPSIVHASKKFLLKNKSFLLRILKQDLSNAALKALMNDNDFKSLFRDKEFVIEWLKVRGDIFISKYFPRDLYGSDKDVALAAVLSNGENLDEISLFVRQDESFITECAKHGVFPMIYGNNDQVQYFERLQRVRMEAEYYGCHIPSHYKISKPIQRLYIDDTIHMSGTLDTRNWVDFVKFNKVLQENKNIFETGE